LNSPVPRTPSMSDAEKPEFRQANDNPWYCLATLYGEQPTQAAVGDWDVELAAKNRWVWNRWMATHLSDVQRTGLVREGFAEASLVPLTPDEQTVLCSAFATRMGRENELPPNPAKGIDFTHTHFGRTPIFNGFLFASRADFSSATFLHNAHFMGTRFFDGVLFRSTTFAGNAYLRSTFSGTTIFDSVTFSGVADFWHATFSFYVYFHSTLFSESADFRSATFSKNASFTKAQFNTFALFDDVCFETSVPDFRGARMHEATQWGGTKWPAAPRDKAAAQDQVYAYERLKQEMERLKKYEDEQFFFFRKELRARRGLLSARSGGVASQLHL
jgi:uncharacterized protein YjbI with pentapeptide repeats